MSISLKDEKNAQQVQLKHLDIDVLFKDYSELGQGAYGKVFKMTSTTNGVAYAFKSLSKSSIKKNDVVREYK